MTDIQQLKQKKENLQKWQSAVSGMIILLILGLATGWSKISNKMIVQLGVVSSSSKDWSMQDASVSLMLFMTVQSSVCMLIGSFIQRKGPQFSTFVGSILIGIGFISGGIGLHLHSLWMVNLGLGGFLGLALGFCYVPILNNVGAHFIENKGKAIGYVFSAHGIGGYVFVFLIDTIIPYFAKPSIYIGSLQETTVKIIDGVQFVNGQEVVYATSSELMANGLNHLSEGYYLVGSGDTGLSSVLIIIGLVYSLISIIASSQIKSPQNLVQHKDSEDNDSVKYEVAITTRQFFLFGFILMLSDSIGLGVITVFKPMILKQFQKTMPNYVTQARVSSWTQWLSICSTAARILIGIFIDRFSAIVCAIVQSTICILFCLIGPMLVDIILVSPSIPLLYLYLISIIGLVGIQASFWIIVPNLTMELFGIKHNVRIYGGIIAFASVSGFLGPHLMLYFEQLSHKLALDKLLSEVDPKIFLSRFTQTIDHAAQLIDSHTITIPILLQIMPDHIQDPQPYLYHLSIHMFLGFSITLFIIIISIQMLKPNQINQNHNKNQDKKESDQDKEETKKLVMTKQDV